MIRVVLFRFGSVRKKKKKKSHHDVARLHQLDWEDGRTNNITYMYSRYGKRDENVPRPREIPQSRLA